MPEKMSESTAMDNSGLSTLHRMPSALRAYLRRSSRIVSSRTMNACCFIHLPPAATATNAGRAGVCWDDIGARCLQAMRSWQAADASPSA